MPGPWIHLPRNQDYFKELTVSEGGYVELEVVDGEGQPQGTALWQIDHLIEKKKEGIWLSGRLIAATDEHLQWWLTKGPGKSYGRNFVVHLCATPAGECKKTKRNREKEFHSDTFRDIQAGDILARRVTWFSQDDVKTDIDKEIANLAGTTDRYDPASMGGGREPGPERLDWEAEEKVEDKGAPAGEDIPGRLAALKKAVSGKEPGDDRLDKDQKKKKKREEGDISGKKAERTKAAKRVKAKAAEPLWFGHPQEPDSGADTSSSMGVLPAEKADDEAPTDPKRGRSRKKQKLKSGKRAKRTSGSSKKKPLADRGPFGVGHRVKFGDEKSGSRSSDDEEDSGSDFRAGPSNKSRQLQLQEYSEQHPGGLAARLLQRMQEILARQEGPMHTKTERNLTPATATSYFLTVIIPQYREKMNLRTSRELRTLCKALDLIANGNPESAGDILGQRVKSLELYLSDQAWSRAQHLELIPPEGVNLVGKDETLMATKEQATEQKMKLLIAGQQWKGNSKGKMSDYYEKGKGKGKEKGKKGKSRSENAGDMPTA